MASLLFKSTKYRSGTRKRQPRAAVSIRIQNIARWVKGISGEGGRRSFRRPKSRTSQTLPHCDRPAVVLAGRAALTRPLPQLYRTTLLHDRRQATGRGRSGLAAALVDVLVHGAHNG